MDAIVYGVSIFVGLVAGVIVSLAVEFFKRKYEFKQEVKNLHFEMICNLKKINQWLEEIGELKGKVNEGRLLEFYGFFNFSYLLYGTAGRLFQQGTIYRCLEDGNIEKLQELVNFLNMNSEISTNCLINYWKQNYVLMDKMVMLRQIETWENMLKRCRSNVEAINKELEQFGYIKHN